MRVKFARLITILVIVLNFLALYCIWKLLAKYDTGKNVANLNKVHSSDILSSAKLERTLTLVIRRFEFFDNDVVDTIKSFLSVLANVDVLIVCDSNPYPPLDIYQLNNTYGNIRLVSTQFKLLGRLEERNPLYHINTKYTLIIPDSVRLRSPKSVRTLLTELKHQPQNIISAAVGEGKFIDCLNVYISIREWLLQYTKSNENVCDAVAGKHVLFAETRTFRKLSEPFMNPFPDALYIQSSAHNIKVTLLFDADFSDGKQLYQSQHAQWKIRQIESNRLKTMFHKFNIKKVVRETGVIEWYGCDRNTPRCFGTVIGDVPQYLLDGKWTPPCCLAGLRQTAQHVFNHLEESNIRYWLEGGSLLGAMRSGDIIPWDYDVDVGIYKNDIINSPLLTKAQTQSVTDNDGFIWEKAREGDFFRVQFSQINHLHIDLFPFFVRNGTMTKSTWFPTHKQDREFPEHYLRPLSSIQFIGRQVSAPNNIHDFLELKFGKGAIENPEYPKNSRMRLPFLKTNAKHDAIG